MLLKIVLQSAGFAPIPPELIERSSLYNWQLIFGIFICLASLRHALALVRVQKAFAQSDRVWRDLNELVIVDIRDRLFQ